VKPTCGLYARTSQFAPDSDITGYNAAAHLRVLRSSTSLRARRMRQLDFKNSGYAPT